MPDTINQSPGHSDTLKTNWFTPDAINQLMYNYIKKNMKIFKYIKCPDLDSIKVNTPNHTLTKTYLINDNKNKLINQKE